MRYRPYDQSPKPIARAVMFCLMDVSGSMDEHMKDLAKRFYSLLYLFLKRRYKRVDVVFIRHTHEAKEVDEQTFFHSRETGGTVVSTALERWREIIQERYPVDQWNIYVRAGVRRRQPADGQFQRDQPARDRDPADVPVLCLSRSRTCQGRWRRATRPRCGGRMSCVAGGDADDGDAQGEPSQGHLPGVP